MVRCFTLQSGQSPSSPKTYILVSDLRSETPGPHILSLYMQQWARLAVLRSYQAVKLDHVLIAPSRVNFASQQFVLINSSILKVGKVLR
jgi:hypothetical protein